MDAPELVIDTNVIIDYKKRKTPGKEALAELVGQEG